MQTCEHLESHSNQASAAVNGGRYCAPCAAEQITAMVHTVAPTAIPYHVSFNECAHPHNGSRCGICYAGGIGCLLLHYSYLLSNEDSKREKNRLANAIRALVKFHGPVALGVVGPDEQ